MADMEVLAPGGHQHLVEKIKEQLAMKADASLASAVEKVIENQPTAVLSGTVLTASDTYAEPPVALTVDGKSTQVTTTGKNLFDKSAVTPNRYINSSGGLSAWNAASASDYIPVEPNTSYTLSFADVCGNQGIAFYTDANVESFISYTSVSTTTLLTFTTPENAAYLRFSCFTTVLDSAQLESGSTATVYEPYTGGKPSPRPDWPQEIVSVDELALEICGKNLLNINTSGTWKHAGLTVSVQNGAITRSGTHTSVPSPNSRAFAIGNGNISTTTGTNYAGQISIGSAFAMRLLAGTYRFSCAGNSSPFTVSLKYGRIGTTGTTVSSGNTFTVSEDCYYCLAVQVNSYETDATYTVYPQLEVGFTTTDFAPYVGHTIPIDLQDHVLRSLPDGTKDTLALSYLRPSTREGWAWYTREVNRPVGRVMLDGSESWTATSGTSYRMYVRHNDIKRESDYAQKLLCSSLKAYTSSGYLGNGVTGISAWPDEAGYPDQNWFYVAIDGITTAAAMKQWFTDNPAEVLYELVTPTTTTLDPIELPILPAPNVTVWADPSTGLQMRYVRDMQIVIDSLNSEIERAYAAIAPVESTTAKSNHAVGDYLMLGGTLCKATSAIASGETIAIGTNVTATTVDAELASLE